MSYIETKSRVCSFVHASESFFKALHQTKVNTLQQVSLGHHDMCWSTRNHHRYQQFCWKYIMPLRLSLSRLLRLTFEFSAVSSMGCCAISSSGAESCSCNLHHSLWGQGSEEYQNHLPFGIPSRGFRWKTSLQLWLHDQVCLSVPLMQYGVLVVYMQTNYQQKSTPCITISQNFPIHEQTFWYYIYLWLTIKFWCSEDPTTSSARMDSPAIKRVAAPLRGVDGSSVQKWKP